MPRKRIRISEIVIDTSCLICLWELGFLPKLALRYNTVHIPRHVFEEARRKGRVKRRLQELIGNYDSLLKICDIGNAYDAQLLYDRFRNPDARIDGGEAEVIIQARELGVSEVLIDEPKGRTVATLHTLSVRGTLSVLIELKLNGLIAEVQPLVVKLGKKLRIKHELLKQELEKVGETID